MAWNPLDLPADQVDPPKGGLNYNPGGSGFPGTPGGPSPGSTPGGGGAGGSFLSRAYYNPTVPIGAYRRTDPTGMSHVAGPEGAPAPAAPVSTGNPLLDLLAHGDQTTTNLLTQHLPTAGPKFDPNDPYGSFSGDPRTDLSGLVNRIIGSLGKGGNLDPNSIPPELMSLLQQLGIGNQGAYESRARTSLDARGGMTDPALYGATVANAGSQAQSDLSHAMTDSGLSLAGHQNDQLMSILEAALGGNTQGQLIRTQAAVTPKPGFDWGALLGQGVGAAIGAMGPHK